MAKDLAPSKLDGMPPEVGNRKHKGVLRIQGDRGTIIPFGGGQPIRVQGRLSKQESTRLLVAGDLVSFRKTPWSGGRQFAIVIRALR
jgi:hypothetical protein